MAASALTSPSMNPSEPLTMLSEQSLSRMPTNDASEVGWVLGILEETDDAARSGLLILCQLWLKDVVSLLELSTLTSDCSTAPRRGGMASGEDSMWAARLPDCQLKRRYYGIMESLRLRILAGPTFACRALEWNVAWRLRLDAPIRRILVSRIVEPTPFTRAHLWHMPL